MCAYGEIRYKKFLACELIFDCQLTPYAAQASQVRLKYFYSIFVT